jgi:transaldolase
LSSTRWRFKSCSRPLRELTVVVADTGNIQPIERVKPQDATTNPSLITAAAELPQYRSITDLELIKARKRLGVSASDEDVVNYAMKRIAIAFGKKILAVVPGRGSTEVHPHFSNDSEATVREANEIIGLYDEQGISRDRILVKIASTWEGLRAAEKLEQQGIHCNLTLLFGIH